MDMKKSSNNNNNSSSSNNSSNNNNNNNNMVWSDCLKAWMFHVSLPWPQIWRPGSVIQTKEACGTGRGGNGRGGVSWLARCKYMTTERHPIFQHVSPWIYIYFVLPISFPRPFQLVDFSPFLGSPIKLPPPVPSRFFPLRESTVLRGTEPVLQWGRLHWPRESVGRAWPTEPVHVLGGQTFRVGFWVNRWIWECKIRLWLQYTTSIPLSPIYISFSTSAPRFLINIDHHCHPLSMSHDHKPICLVVLIHLREKIVTLYSIPKRSRKYKKD